MFVTTGGGLVAAREIKTAARTASSKTRAINRGPFFMTSTLLESTIHSNINNQTNTTARSSRKSNHTEILTNFQKECRRKR
jgi:hypothetical protein